LAPIGGPPALGTEVPREKSFPHSVERCEDGKTKKQPPRQKGPENGVNDPLRPSLGQNIHGRKNETRPSDSRKSEPLMKKNLPSMAEKNPLPKRKKRKDESAIGRRPVKCPFLKKPQKPYMKRGCRSGKTNPPPRPIQQNPQGKRTRPQIFGEKTMRISRPRAGGARKKTNVQHQKKTKGPLCTVT